MVGCGQSIPGCNRYLKIFDIFMNIATLTTCSIVQTITAIIASAVCVCVCACVHARACVCVSEC